MHKVIILKGEDSNLLEEILKDCMKCVVKRTIETCGSDRNHLDNEFDDADETLHCILGLKTVMTRAKRKCFGLITDGTKSTLHEDLTHWDIRDFDDGSFRRRIEQIESIDLESGDFYLVDKPEKEIKEWFNTELKTLLNTMRDLHDI